MPGSADNQKAGALGWRSCLVLLVAIGFSLALGGGLLLVRGVDPVAAMGTLFVGAFGSRYGIEDSALKAIPIFLCSLGVALAFRLRVWKYRGGGPVCAGRHRGKLAAGCHA